MSLVGATVGLQLGRPGVYLAPPRATNRLTAIRLDIAGFVGVAPRGPVDEPVAVTGWTDYERRFGGFEPLAGGTPLLPYAVEAFFAQGGERAWIVRVAPPPGSPGPTAREATAFYRLGPPGRERLLWAANEGTWGGRLQITLDFVVERTVTMTVRPDLTAILPTGTILPEQTLGRVRRPDLPAAGVFCWVSRIPDPVRGDRHVRLDPPLPPPEDPGTPTRLEVVSATLTTTDGSPGLPRTERLTGLGLRPDHPRYLPQAVSAESQLLTTNPDRLPGAPLPPDWSEPLFPDPLLTRLIAKPGQDQQGEDQQGRDRSHRIGSDSFFDDGPADADPLDEAAVHRGVDGLGRVPELGICCVPDLTWSGDPDVTLDGRDPVALAQIVARQSRVVEVADWRRQFVTLLDVPNDLSPEAITDWRSQFSSSYVAGYHPWLAARRREPDGRVSVRGLVGVPPSAYAAGITAARERRLGLSHGAANELARGAVRAVEQPAEALADRLHLLGINVFLPERDGFRLTASRTLAADPGYRQLSVRRLMTMLALVLQRQTQWLVFEPNTPALRARITHCVTQLLREQHRRGAFAGATEAESFFVRCDDTTNPPESLALGRLITEVGVAPAAPLEYLVLRITHDVEGGVSVREAGP